jgi:hypothetical protein
MPSKFYKAGVTRLPADDSVKINPSQSDFQLNMWLVIWRKSTPANINAGQAKEMGRFGERSRPILADLVQSLTQTFHGLAEVERERMQVLVYFVPDQAKNQTRRDEGY